MGHHSKKNAQATQTTQTAQSMPPYAPSFDINGIGQLLNNIDVNSMANMMKNIDINQVMSMMSKTIAPQPNAAPANTPDNTANNTGSSSTDNTPKTGNINPFNMFNIPGFNAVPIQPQPLNPILPSNDPTVMVLNSLKPFLPPDKCKVIDDIIQLLGIKLVIDKVFPPGIFSSSNANVKKAPDKTENEQSDDKAPSSE
jgi:hypothetical protein